MHCNMKAARRRTSRSWAVLAELVLRMRAKCYIPGSDQNSDSGITFSDSDFLKNSNNLAMGGRFDYLTLNVCSTSGVT